MPDSKHKLLYLSTEGVGLTDEKLNVFPIGLLFFGSRRSRWDSLETSLNNVISFSVIARDVFVTI